MKKFLNNQNNTPRLRTIPKAIEEIKTVDPNTALTLRALRRMVNNGEVKTINIGNKHLINLDELMDFLSTGCYNDNAICASDERSA